MEDPALETGGTGFGAQELYEARVDFRPLSESEEVLENDSQLSLLLELLLPELLELRSLLRLFLVGLFFLGFCFCLRERREAASWRGGLFSVPEE